jgi:hypothetical protein
MFFCFLFRTGSMGPSSPSAQPQKATMLQMSTRMGCVADVYRQVGHGVRSMWHRIIFAAPLLPHALLGLFEMWSWAFWGPSLPSLCWYHLWRLFPQRSLPQHGLPTQVPSECDARPLRSWWSEMEAWSNRNCYGNGINKQFVLNSDTNLEDVWRVG